MRDGSQMEEVTGAVSLGLFAGDAVFALGRVISTGSVAEDDRPILERGQQLLEALGAPVDAPTPPGGPRHLALGGSALDVLAAVETEAAEVAVEDFLRPLADALKESLDGKVEGHTDHLKTLRRVFAAIGDVEVSRVSQLSRPRPPSLPSWRT